MNLFATAKRNLAGIRTYEPGKPLEELEREYGIRNAVKMASNENALGPSRKALSALRGHLPSVHRYPDGNCFYLRRKLSKFLSVAPESLVFGNGSDEVLVFAVRAFVGPGDEVVIAEPTFLIYEIATQVEGGRVLKTPMKDFRYDLSAMLSKIGKKTKLIFIANPDNPVGTYVSRGELLAFLKRVPRRVLVVLDEAYFEFASVKRDYPDSLKLLKTFRNLIVTRTFSKAYGLSGLRVGYGVMDPSIARAFNKVREPFNVNLLAQAAAAAALDDKSHLVKTLRMVKEGRDYFFNEFRKLGLSYVDTVTNFVLVNLKTDANAVYEALLRRGVIVRSMGAWRLKTFIRVTIGKRSENERFIKELRKTINHDKHKRSLK